jgi:hypothetical protein
MAWSSSIHSLQGQGTQLARAPAKHSHGSHPVQPQQSLPLSIALVTIEGHGGDSMRDTGLCAGDSAYLSDSFGAPLQAG